MIYELCIYVGRPLPHAQPGDVVSIRPPSAGIGRKERSRHLWVRAELDLAALQRHVKANQRLHLHLPLGRLKQILPGFDSRRAQDEADEYQPFLPIDQHGRFVGQPARIGGHGLIIDRATGKNL